MRRIQLLVVLGLVSACARTAPSLQPSAAPAEIEAEPAEPTPAVPDDETLQTAMAEPDDPQTTVIVIEAEDLGGGPDAIVAPPKRPSLPSMMTDIAMAPSR